MGAPDIKWKKPEAYPEATPILISVDSLYNIASTGVEPYVSQEGEYVDSLGLGDAERKAETRRRFENVGSEIDEGFCFMLIVECPGTAPRVGHGRHRLAALKARGFSTLWAIPEEDTSPEGLRRIQELAP